MFRGTRFCVTISISDTLYYMVQADENHTDLTGEPIDVSIAKRKLVITAEPKQKICGGKDPELTYLV